MIDKNLYKDLENHILELKKTIESKNNLPTLLKEQLEKDILSLYQSIGSDFFDQKYDLISRYINWVVKFPFGQYSQDNLDIERAKAIFEENHYGMQKVKQRFLEYISVLNLRKQKGMAKLTPSTVLLLVGLAGTGKTTFAYSLAQALNRKIFRISFATIANVYQLKGRSRFAMDSEPGLIVKGLVKSEVLNPIILLDEIDRVTDENLTAFMGILIEMLDPAQNVEFFDNYLNMGVDLSQAIFIATANNTTRILTAVLDRMEKISMPSYSNEEKIIIGKKYLLPKILEEAGLNDENLVIDSEVWPDLVRPLGFDAGLRTLKRTLETIARRVAFLIVEQKYEQVVISKENFKQFIDIV